MKVALHEHQNPVMIQRSPTITSEQPTSFVDLFFWLYCIPSWHFYFYNSQLFVVVGVIWGYFVFCGWLKAEWRGGSLQSQTHQQPSPWLYRGEEGVCTCSILQTLMAEENERNPLQCSNLFHHLLLSTTATVAVVNSELHRRGSIMYFVITRNHCSHFEIFVENCE